MSASHVSSVQDVPTKKAPNKSTVLEAEAPEPKAKVARRNNPNYFQLAPTQLIRTLMFIK